MFCILPGTRIDGRANHIGSVGLRPHRFVDELGGNLVAICFALTDLAQYCSLYSLIMRKAPQDFLDPPVDFRLELQFFFHDVRLVSALDLIKLQLFNSLKRWTDETRAEQV